MFVLVVASDKSRPTQKFADVCVYVCMIVKGLKYETKYRNSTIPELD
jgi:hypothetical protein